MTGLRPFPTAVAVVASRCPVTARPLWCQVTAPLATGEEEEEVGVAASSYLQACCTGKLRYHTTIPDTLWDSYKHPGLKGMSSFQGYPERIVVYVSHVIFSIVTIIWGT